MDIFESSYYRFYRLFLCLVGQWPYQKARYLVLWKILLSCVLGSFFVVQVLKITWKPRDDTNMVFETLAILISTVLCFVKYLTCWVNSDIVSYCQAFEDRGHSNSPNIIGDNNNSPSMESDKLQLKELLDRINEDWRETMSKSEMTIMQNNTLRGRLYSISCTQILYASTFVLIVRILLPEILNAFTSVKLPRFVYEPILGNYLVSMDDYFFFINLHAIMVVLVALSVTMAADVLFFAIISHACGMFSVIGHRLEHAFDKDAPDSNTIDKSHKAVIRVLEHHKRTIEFVRIINSCYMKSCVIQLIFIVIDFSILMLHLSYALSKKNNMDQIVITILNVAGHCLIIFFNCIPGQMLLDSSAAVFRKAYCGLWYTASSQSQKILLLIMLRSMQPAAVTAANVFTASFELFGSVMQSSLSYFMVLHSLQSQSS